MKQKLKAILFDFDGTLVNSESLHYEALNDILKAYGTSYGWEYYSKNLAGKPAINFLEKVIAENNLDITLDDLNHKKEEASYDKLRSSPVVFMNGAIETLDFFAQKSITLALVTGSDREMVTIIFNKTDLSNYFKTTVTATDVTETKPHPESYLQAMQNLGLKPENCIAIEDTLSGLTAAKDAGLTCLVVQHDVSLHSQLQSADAIFEKLEEAKEYILENFELQAD